MLRPFRQHHLYRAQHGALTNAIRHCHAPNLTSVMLHDEPGSVIRMFFAHRGHNLHMNLGTGRMSVAIHSHRFDTMLVPIFGRVYNVVYEHDDDGQPFEACRYSSGVTDAPALAPIGRTVRLRQRFIDCVLPPNGQALTSSALHTIAVERGKEAAWLVFEGLTDPDYDSTCYTNNPRFDATGLYVRDPRAAEWVLRLALAEVPR